MKKILVCVLVLVMCITAFVACNPTDDTTPDLSGLNSAKAYLQNQYRDEATNTLGDFERLATLKVGTATFTVEWTASVTSGPQTITVVDNEDGTVTIDIEEVDETVTEDTLYTLTATITDANGNSTTLTYNHMIPKFAVNTFEEYVAAEAGESIIIDGIVTGILPKGNGATNDGFYMNTLDGGGVYVYQTSGAELKVGQTIRVKGTKDVYNGTHELKDSTYEVLDANVTTVTPVDYTEIYTNAENLKDKALVEKQALLVTIKGVTIDTVGGSDGSYYYFELAGKKSYIRISGSSCPMTTAEQTAFIDAFKANLGATADVTGLITLYSGAFYLTPVSANAISNIVAAQIPDDERVSREKELLSLEDSYKADFTLPNGTWADVAWSVEGTGATIGADNAVTVARGEADQTVTFTATITSGEATDTKTFTVVIPAAPKTANVIVEAPVANGEYYFMLTHTNLNNKELFITGEMDGFYYGTTEDVASAVKVKVLDLGEGKYHLMVGEKYLDVVVSGTHINVVYVDAAPTSHFTWNSDLNTFVIKVNDTDYIYGTNSSKTFDTFSACKLADAAKTCIAHLIEVKNVGANIVSAPVANGEYYFMLTHTNLNNKELFITGEMDGFYYGTTEDVASAVKVKVLDLGEGKYHLMVGEKYLDVVVSGTHINVVYVDAAPTSHFTWNSDLNTFVIKVNDTDYIYGTSSSKTYDTFSACKLADAANTCIAHLVDWVADPNATPDDGGETPEPTPAEKITTIAGALAVESGEAELSGTVAKITYAWNGTTCSFDLTDGTNTINVYKSTTNVTVGDVVTVVGNISVYNKKHQISEGSTVTVTTAHVCADWSAADCENPALCKVCGAVKADSQALGHTDPNTENKCDRCGVVLNVAAGTYTYDIVNSFGTYAKDWTSDYVARETASTDFTGSLPKATITFSRANKQAQTITDRPVLAPKGNTQYVTVVIEGNTISSVTFALTQWGTKTFSDIHIEYFDGTAWVSCSDKITTPANITSTTLPANVTQVRLSVTATGSSNVQVGVGDITVVVA